MLLEHHPEAQSTKMNNTFDSSLYQVNQNKEVRINVKLYDKYYTVQPSEYTWGISPWTLGREIWYHAREQVTATW